ncbi:MAG: uracil-DNA glycosylase [Rickettsiales bacterium]|nr:uracil-DNA glycosylase [Rickettsiales bacterium]
MGLYSLRDLELSGVKWELSETPAAMGRPKKPAVAAAPTESAVRSASPTAAATGVMAPPVAVIPAARPVTLSCADDAARGACDLPALRDAIVKFEHPLKQFVKNTVAPHFADGDLLIITDAPSGDDDDSGQILTGAAGGLMDKMLAAIGMSRAQVSIVPLVFWRTPGGRAPSREELDLARPFVDRAAALLKPKAILTLGILTAAEVANAKLPKDHGNRFETAGGIPVFPIYHPNYLMLKPDVKKDVWSALQELQKLLKNPQESL